MAHYLVTARARGALQVLEHRLRTGDVGAMRPFGGALAHALTHARVRSDGRIVWEEEDYCDPPLAMEREAVLDDYFEEIEVEPVTQGHGWRLIEPLPRLFRLPPGDEEDEEMSPVASGEAPE